MTSQAQFEEGRTIIWLASYPKSGNTWLRSLLTVYCFPDDNFNINDLVGAQNPFDRQLLDDSAGITSSDMTEQELIPYQAQLNRQLAREAISPYFIKTHSAYLHSSRGEALFPADASAGAIYIIRNPLDVVPSFAHHEGRDLDWAITQMANPQAGMDKAPGRSTLMLPQTMSSWSGNVESWLQQDQIPIHLLRYEDLHDDPEKHFADVLRFCAIEVDMQRLNAAIDRCRIDRLQQDEEADGFNERPSPGRPFFRAGRIGDGQVMLDEVQKNRLWGDHAKVATRLGYELESCKAKALED